MNEQMLKRIILEELRNILSEQSSSKNIEFRGQQIPLDKYCQMMKNEKTLTYYKKGFSVINDPQIFQKLKQALEKAKQRDESDLKELKNLEFGAYLESVALYLPCDEASMKSPQRVQKFINNTKNIVSNYITLSNIAKDLFNKLTDLENFLSKNIK